MSTSPSRVNSFNEMLKGYLELRKTLFLTNINLFVSVGDEKSMSNKNLQLFRLSVASEKLAM